MSEKSSGAETPEAPSEILSLLKQLNQLELERIELIGEFEKLIAENRPLIRGSLYERTRKCGKKNCRRCANEEFHKAKYLSVSIEGRAEKIRVKNSEEQRYIDGTRRYKVLSRIRKQLSELCKKQFDLIGNIRDAQLEEITPPPNKPGRKSKKK